MAKPAVQWSSGRRYVFLGLLCLIFPIIGAIKANDGEVWPYPLSIRFFGK